MTSYVRASVQLSYLGAALAIEAARAKAAEIGVPQNVCVVDAGGNLLAFARMDGAHMLAQHASISKAQTAASLGIPSGRFPAQFGVDLALATGGRSINMIGGLPIFFDGEMIGAVGVSSGNDAEDMAVAEAARDAVIEALSQARTPKQPS